MPSSVAAEPTRRVLLARAALGAALAVPGVAGPTAGRAGLHVTADRSERLAGVTAAADAGGRFSVDLYLVARLVPLAPLVEAVRRRVADAAMAAGLGDALGAVNVTIADVEHPS